MGKTLVEILKRREQERINAHLPAKDSPVLSKEEQSDLDAFVEAYEQAWIEQRDQSRAIEDDGFHPSTLGITVGKCGRRNVYLLRGVRKEFNHDPRTMRVFANGHGVHERTQTVLENMGIEMESELNINYENPPIRGHADGRLKWMGRDIALEIKSCSDEVFVNRLKWRKPKDEHFAQVNIYAHILGLDIVWILYENKNTQEVKIFEKKTDHEAAQKQIDKWHSEWLCHLDGELPERPYKIGSPTCAGCDLKTHCNTDEEIGVSLKPYKKKVEELHADAA